MVKSALLYADRVELISPGAAMISAVTASANRGLDGLLDVLESLDPTTRAAMGAPDFPSNIREIVAGMIALDAISDADLWRVSGGVGLTRDQRGRSVVSWLARRQASSSTEASQFRRLQTLAPTSSPQRSTPDWSF